MICQLLCGTLLITRLIRHAWQLFYDMLATWLSQDIPTMTERLLRIPPHAIGRGEGDHHDLMGQGWLALVILNLSIRPIL